MENRPFQHAPCAGNMRLAHAASRRVQRSRAVSGARSEESEKTLYNISSSNRFCFCFFFISVKNCLEMLIRPLRIDSYPYHRVTTFFVKFSDIYFLEGHSYPPMIPRASPTTSKHFVFRIFSTCHFPSSLLDFHHHPSSIIIIIIIHIMNNDN